MYRLLVFVVAALVPAVVAAQPAEDDVGGETPEQQDEETASESSEADAADPADDEDASEASEDEDAAADEGDADDAAADEGDAGDAVPPEPPEPPDASDEEGAADGAVPAESEAQETEEEGDEPEGESNGESGFMDVRLNLTLTNENVFAEPGETIPSVPGWRFGQPNSLGTLFFENYDTRFSGYETLSHMVLYRQHNEENWEAEGALVLRLNDLAEDRIDLSDAGSYLRVAYWLDEDRVDPKRVSFTAFPTSSDRFRLGYSYRLSWGGSPTYQRSRAAVPGVKLQYESGRFYGFVGAKSAVVLDRETSEEEAVMGGLAGVGYDVSDMVRLEMSGGYFDRGGNELQDVIDQSVHLYGASAQFAIHEGQPVGSSIDYMLYRNDPERVGRLFAPERYPGGLSWVVKGEYSLLGQTLKDPNITGGTMVQPAAAGDINVRAKYNYTRFRFDAQYRDLAYILHTTPSLPTYSAFPDSYDQRANFFVAGGADHHFEATGLTLGLTLGLDVPATLTTPTGALPGDTSQGAGESTAVVRDPERITILPEGERALPQFASKLRGRVDFNQYFAGLVDAYYSYDPNQTRLRREGPEAPLEREFGELNQLGFNLTLQSRF